MRPFGATAQNRNEFTNDPTNQAENAEASGQNGQSPEDFFWLSWCPLG